MLMLNYNCVMVCWSVSFPVKMDGNPIDRDLVYMHYLNRHSVIASLRLNKEVYAVSANQSALKLSSPTKRGDNFEFSLVLEE